MLTTLALLLLLAVLPGVHVYAPPGPADKAALSREKRAVYYYYSPYYYSYNTYSQLLAYYQFMLQQQQTFQAFQSLPITWYANLICSVYSQLATVPGRRRRETHVEATNDAHSRSKRDTLGMVAVYNRSLTPQEASTVRQYMEISQEYRATLLCSILRNRPTSYALELVAKILENCIRSGQEQTLELLYGQCQVQGEITTYRAFVATFQRFINSNGFDFIALKIDICLALSNSSTDADVMKYVLEPRLKALALPDPEASISAVRSLACQSGADTQSYIGNYVTSACGDVSNKQYFCSIFQRLAGSTQCSTQVLARYILSQCGCSLVANPPATTQAPVTTTLKPTTPTTTTKGPTTTTPKPTTKTTTASTTTTSTTATPKSCGISTRSTPSTSRDFQIVQEILKTTRIVGGKPTTPGINPWLVSLIISDSNLCGGSILDECTVITAAHCCVNEDGTTVAASAIKISANDTNLLSSSDGQVSVGVREIFVHPQYDNQPTQPSGDVAILKLSPCLTFSPNVQPVCLPDNQDCNSVEGDGTVVGWGTTAEGGTASVFQPQEVTLPLYNSTSCTKTFSTSTYASRVSPYQLCAGRPEGGQDSCQGDSGGPLVTFSETGMATLTGVVSYGYGCARSGEPGIYTCVGAYGSWIKQHVGA